MANLLVSRATSYKIGQSAALEAEGAKIICCVFTQKYLAGTGAVGREGR